MTVNLCQNIYYIEANVKLACPIQTATTRRPTVYIQQEISTFDRHLSLVGGLFNNVFGIMRGNLRASAIGRGTEATSSIVHRWTSDSFRGLATLLLPSSVCCPRGRSRCSRPIGPGSETLTRKLPASRQRHMLLPGWPSHPATAQCSSAFCDIRDSGVSRRQRR